MQCQTFTRVTCLLCTECTTGSRHIRLQATMKYVRIYHAPPEEFDVPMLASALGKRKRALQDAAAELQELQNASSSTSSGVEQHSGRSPHRNPVSGRFSGATRQPQADHSSTCSSSTDEGQEEDLDSDGEAALRQQQVALQEEFACTAATIRVKKQKLEAENTVSLKRLEAIEQRLEELREQKQALFKQLKKANEAEDLARRAMQAAQGHPYAASAATTAATPSGATTGPGYVSFTPSGVPQHHLASPFMTMQGGAPWPPPPPPPRRPTMDAEARRHHHPHYQPHQLAHTYSSGERQGSGYQGGPLPGPPPHASPAAGGSSRAGTPEPLEEGEMAPSPISSGDVPRHLVGSPLKPLGSNPTASSGDLTAQYSAAVSVPFERQGSARHGYSSSSYAGERTHQHTPSSFVPPRPYGHQHQPPPPPRRTSSGDPGGVWRQGSGGLSSPDSVGRGAGAQRGGGGGGWGRHQQQQQQQQQEGAQAPGVPPAERGAARRASWSGPGEKRW